MNRIENGVERPLEYILLKKKGEIIKKNTALERERTTWSKGPWVEIKHTMHVCMYCICLTDNDHFQTLTKWFYLLKYDNSPTTPWFQNANIWKNIYFDVLKQSMNVINHPKLKFCLVSGQTPGWLWSIHWRRCQKLGERSSGSPC